MALLFTEPLQLAWCKELVRYGMLTSFSSGFQLSFGGGGFNDAAIAEGLSEAVMTFWGRPLPATSMGVGQFFNPQEGKRTLSLISLVLSMCSQKDMILREDHSLVFYLSFPVILGILPVSLVFKTTGYGIKKSEFSDDEPEDPGIGRVFPLFFNPSILYEVPSV